MSFEVINRYIYIIYKMNKTKKSFTALTDALILFWGAGGDNHVNADICIYIRIYIITTICRN